MKLRLAFHMILPNNWEMKKCLRLSLSRYVNRKAVKNLLKA